jgi:hypothetical protein
MTDRESRIKAAIERSYRKLDPQPKHLTKKTSTPKPDIPYESYESIKFAGLLRKWGVFFTHVANERKTSAISGYHLKNMGVTKGCPDFLIFSPIPGASGIAIEMKRCLGVKVSTSREQKEFLTDLASCGWRSYVCRGYKAAMSVLLELGVRGKNEQFIYNDTCNKSGRADGSIREFKKVVGRVP